MNILEIKDVSKSYGNGELAVKALSSVNLSVERGEFVSIVGSSGSGKSTLLNIIGGLDRADSGIVKIEGISIGDLSESEMTIFRRRRIGFVFQSYNLVPVMSSYENICMPVELDGKSPNDDYLDELVKSLGIEHLLDRLPGQLSGGQQQRVAIARAMISKPAIILADEPTGNLDSRTGLDVLNLLKLTGQKYASTILMITHNEQIASLSDRIVRIEDGKISER